MANYANLLATIAANIYTNNNNEVTAAMVKTAVDAMVASLGAGYQFMGVATPATTPGNTDIKQFYLASEPGIYTGFDNLTVSGAGLLLYDTLWSFSPFPMQIIDGTDEFVIADENDAQVLKIVGGEIKTRKFDSAKTPHIDDEPNYDYAISDDGGNIILALKDGNLKTKNFDSSATPKEEKSIDSLRSKTGLMYTKFFDLSSDMSEYVVSDPDNNKLTEDGLLLSATGGGNVILNKYYSIGFRSVEYLCRFSAGSVAVFTTDAGGPFISVDFINNTLTISNIAAGWAYGQEVPIDPGISSHLFKVVVTKRYQEQSAKLIDISVDKTYTVSVTQDGQGGAGAGSVNPDPTKIGMQSDKYKFYAEQGTFVVKHIRVYAGVNNVKLIMYGDSITEPEQYYPKENFLSSWTQLVIAQINGEAVSSGRTGTNIDAVIERIQNELPYINAKYVMVTIGTNSGNTLEKLRNLVDYIKQCGSIPILNNIPCNDNNGTSNTVANNTMIAQVRAEKEIKGCLFNLPTSENGDGETLDYSTMYYEDYPGVGTWYHHPNPKGAEGMFLRTFIDVPEIYE